jgi:CubicO group peptidase (beta-lactamase class C family)
VKRRLFLQRTGALAALAASGNVFSEGQLPALDDLASARLNDFIGKEMITRHIPGLSACLVHKDGHILWSRNFGYANLETNEAMRFDHLQNIASISKTFVTLAAMQQVEAGLMSLDDAVNRHLPFELRHPQHSEKAITIRMLMRHESGIRDGSVYARNYACGDPKMSLGVWVREYFKEGGVFYSADENFAPWAPGEAYEYTNTTFGLLGHLVERTSGLSLPEYCNRNIIAPMKLTGTAWMLSDLDTEKHSIPYTWVEDSVVRGSSWGGIPLGVIRPDGPTYAEVMSDGFHKNCFYNHPNYPDGFLRMSIVDATQWARLWLNDGQVDGIRMLKKASVDQMFRDEAAGPHAESLQGLTWHSGHEMNGIRLWGHDGSDPGVATSLLLAKEAGLAAIVFANSDGVTPADFTTAILREGLQAA